MTGILSAILVDEGDEVKKGQLLFRLDSRQARLAVAQAKAAQRSAEINLQSAQLDYKRTKDLHARGSIAPATFDQSKTRYDAAVTGVKQAKIAVSLATKSAGDASVRSPIRGVVTAKLKNVGETATMVPPTVVLVVQNVAMLELRARLPERSLASLKKGSAIHVSFPALDIRRELSILRLNPSIDARTRTVEVIAKVDNADRKLKPGMLAEVSFGEKESEPAPAITSSAKSKP